MLVATPTAADCAASERSAARTSGRERIASSGISARRCGATSQSRSGRLLSFSCSEPGITPTRIAIPFMHCSSIARMFGIEARVCSTLYFACFTASSSPMPESRRDLRMSYVSLCSLRFVRATRRRSCEVRSVMYWLPISAASETHAFSTEAAAASSEAAADSYERRTPPKMSISHDASNPLEKWSPW